MKKIFLKKSALILTVSAFLITGCKTVENANRSQKGAAIGAASGAVIGGVIGKLVGSKDNTALGAIVGGVVGGAAGAYIGNRMDKQAEAIENQIPGAEVTRVGEGISVTFDENSGVYFETNKSNINAKSQEALSKLSAIFKEYPGTLVLVEGHTDSTGSDEYNLKLSEERAMAVTNYLVSKGLERSMFTTKWYGETQPKYDNATPEGRAKNRRVELAIVAGEQLKSEAERQAGN